MMSDWSNLLPHDGVPASWAILWEINSKDAVRHLSLLPPTPPQLRCPTFGGPRSLSSVDSVSFLHSPSSTASSLAYPASPASELEKLLIGHKRRAAHDDAAAKSPCKRPKGGKTAPLDQCATPIGCGQSLAFLCDESGKYGSPPPTSDGAAKVCTSCEALLESLPHADEVLHCGEELSEALYCSSLHTEEALGTQDDEACGAAAGTCGQFTDANHKLFSAEECVVPFTKVPKDSYIGRLASRWGFSQYATALGTSYFRRLCEMDPSLQLAAVSSPDFCEFAAPTGFPGPWFCPHAAPLRPDVNLACFHLTCITLACKLTEGLPGPALLRRILSKLRDRPVSAAEAMEGEFRILQALGWRLGPHLPREEGPGSAGSPA